MNLNLLYGAAGRILRNTTKDFILYLRYEFEPSLWRSLVVEKEEFAADTEMILVEYSHCPRITEHWIWLIYAGPGLATG